MTVWCVDGFLFKGFLPNLDVVRALPGEKVTLGYDNTLATEENIAYVAAALRRKLRDGDTCVGVSMGAQVLCRLLRDSGRERAADVAFMLLANPEHAVTGRVKTPQYGGVGVPVDTPYRDVVDVAVQYDF